MLSAFSTDATPVEQRRDAWKGVTRRPFNRIDCSGAVGRLPSRMYMARFFPHVNTRRKPQLQTRKG